MRDAAVRPVILGQQYWLMAKSVGAA